MDTVVANAVVVVSVRPSDWLTGCNSDCGWVFGLEPNYSQQWESFRLSRERENE